MKSTVGAVLFLALIIVSGCRKDDSSSKQPAIMEYRVYMGQRLVQVPDTLNNGLVVTRYEMVPGDKMVFKAMYIAEQDDQIYDDEYSETLWFEVDSSLTSFYFEDEDLAVTNAYFIMSGAWVPNKAFEIRDGYIEGTKVSRDYWEVWVDAKADAANEYRIKISLNELFKIITP